MRKKTTAELRELAAEKLAARKEGGTVAEAKSLMNSYYRLCGIEERLLYLENEESTVNLPSTIKLEERRDRWFDKLNEKFKQYDCQMVYFGYCPTICQLGTTQDLYLAYFYN